MTRPISLAHLTLLHLSPPELIRVAAGAGYDFVGLRLLPATPGGPAYLLGDAPMVRETKRAIADTGVGVFDVEIVWLKPETRAENFKACLELGAELGARAVLVVGSDPERERLVDQFAAVCDIAAPLGLTINLEAMRFSTVRSVGEALAVALASGRDNAGVLIDTLHFHFCDNSLDDLQDIPERMLNYMQVCDGPADRPHSDDAMIQVARGGRLLPGEGAIDLASILRRLPQTLPVSLEAPNATLHLTDEERARRGLAATRAVLEQL